MDKQYYKIGEVSKILGVNTSTLRFWESEFRQLNPVKSSTNQRYYTSKHIEFLKRLKTMLHVEKYTIEGAKKKLCLPGRERECAVPSAPASDGPIDGAALKKELLEVLELLK